MPRKTGIIVQARTGSKRLSDKILRTIGDDTTFLDFLLSRLSTLDSSLPLVVATTVHNSDARILQIANKHSIPTFRGSETDVLGRFISCAETFEFDTIIRICADNPFVCLHSIEELCLKYLNQDYLSFEINGRPSILSHCGFFAEMVSVLALRRVKREFAAGCDEHVTNCIYTNRDRFHVTLLPIQLTSDYIRCTLDTSEDLRVLRTIHDQWYEPLEHKSFKYHDLVNFITRRPALLASMRSTIEKNQK